MTSTPCEDCGDPACATSTLWAASTAATAVWRADGSPGVGPLVEAMDRASEAWGLEFDACLIRAATKLRAQEPSDASRWATHFLFAMERVRLARQEMEWYRERWRQVALP